MKSICMLLFIALLAPRTLAFVSPRPLVDCRSPTPAAVSLETPLVFSYESSSCRLYAEETPSTEEKSKLPFFLDPGTKGGAVFLSLVLFLVPIIFYNIILSVSDVDELDLGRWIGVGFTAVATVAWLGTYLFRVVTKDMTYVCSDGYESSCFFFCVRITANLIHYFVPTFCFCNRRNNSKITKMQL